MNEAPLSIELRARETQSKFPQPNGRVLEILVEESPPEVAVLVPRDGVKLEESTTGLLEVVGTGILEELIPRLLETVAAILLEALIPG